MEVTESFLIKTLDTVKNNITVVDESFLIVYTNRAWNEFAWQNGCPKDVNWIGQCYFTPCQTSADDGDEFAVMALDGINRLQRGEIKAFQMEYPCHGTTEDRWFIMQIDKFYLGQSIYYVISHQNITERVQLEQEAQRLSKIDGLTAIANRRAFDQFIELEWYQCMRNKLPMSLMLIDIDEFKSINDTLGHASGDVCLKDLAKLLSKYTARASDICARYGGDEFVVVWGNVNYQQASKLAQVVLQALNEISIKNEHGRIKGQLSTSIGLCTTVPGLVSLKQFIAHTDKLMYEAKATGKNRIVSEPLNHTSDHSTSPLQPK